MRQLALAAALVAALRPDAHAATRAASSLVPLVPVCSGSGTCNSGRGPGCGTDADCDAGRVSPASRWSVDGNLVLRATLRRVTRVDGTPVTTDQTLGTPDDYLLAVCFRAYLPDAVDGCAYTHVELNGGSGRVLVPGQALAAYLPTGTPIELRRVELLAPPSDPSACPGDNDTSDPGRYFADQIGLPTRPGCEDGGALGVGGVVNQVLP
jgi:hypothetical protein